MFWETNYVYNENEIHTVIDIILSFVDVSWLPAVGLRRKIGFFTTRLWCNNHWQPGQETLCSYLIGRVKSQQFVIDLNTEAPRER